MEKTASIGLKERTRPNALSFQIKIDEQKKQLNTIADFLATSDNLGDKDDQNLIRSMVKNNGLLSSAIIFPNGDFIADDGKKGIVREAEFLARAMSGEFSVSKATTSILGNTESVIIITSPIITDGDVRGAISYSYLSNTLSPVFSVDYFDANMQIFVVRKNGEIIMGDTDDLNGNTNIIDYLHSDNNQEWLVGDEGSFLYSVDDSTEKFYINYYYLNINDWYLYTIVPERETTKIIKVVSKEQQFLVLIIAICVILYILAIIFFWNYQRTNIDKLTGAPTFYNFKRKATKMIMRNPHERYLMIKFDVKNFKLINRLYNFDEGDRFIKNISIAMKETLPPNSAYARLNTDIFVLLFPFTDKFTVATIRENFIHTFKKLMGSKFKTIVEFPSGKYITTEQDAINPDIAEIFEKVNFAHQCAKQKGGDVVVDYDEVFEKEAVFQKIIEDRMERALTMGEFTFFLQPKYRVSDEHICGAETLIRWKVDNQFIFHPADFVPVFEKSGFIIKIDMFMYELAVKKIKDIIDMGFAPYIISVNFSRFHLNNEGFVKELCRIADKHSVPHKYLEVELTESVVFDNTNVIIKLLDDLHRNDFTLAMDDFGSGYSSLGLLKNLEIDVMKIDQTFFQNNFDEKRANIVIENIMNLAHDLGIKTVAEGVETKEQVEMLRKFGCDMIQGFYYAKPMPADEFVKKYISEQGSSD